MTSHDAATERAELVARRKVLAKLRDNALQRFSNTFYDVDESQRATSVALSGATADAEAACEAVTSFDAEHPGIRTYMNAEDDDQATQFLRSMVRSIDY